MWRRFGLALMAITGGHNPPLIFSRQQQTKANVQKAKIENSKQRQKLNHLLPPTTNKDNVQTQK